MGASIVVVGTFADGHEKWFDEYSARVRQFLQSRGATTLRRQRVERTLYGDDDADLVMLIDFPTREGAMAAFLEEEYLDLIPLRNRVFSDFRMYLAMPGDI
jgi:uncharacterized protein (DUF1330 family)